MTDSISPAGVHRDMLHMGFSDMDSLRESGIENQLDAKAKDIAIHLNTDTCNILFADSAPGMDEDKLKLSRRLFNRKDATDDKNGCFGIGSSVGSAQLTRLQGKSTRLTRTVGGPLLQLTLDYPKILKTDKYELVPHEATAASSMLWDEYALDQNHGTLDILECPKSVIEDLIRDSQSAEFGRMYSDYLVDGTTIGFFKDGEPLLDVQPEDVSDEKNATHCEKYELLVWGKPTDTTMALVSQFVNGHKKLVYTDPVTGTQVETSPADKGYSLIGPIKCTSTIRYKIKGGADNWRAEDGGHYPKRVRKIIERFPITHPSGGDFQERDIIVASRHAWTYPTSMDPYMGTEINKSRINKSKIRPEILKPLEELSKNFSKRYWKKIKPAEAKKPEVKPEVKVPEVKKPEVKKQEVKPEVKKQEVKPEVKKSEIAGNIVNLIRETSALENTVVQTLPTADKPKQNVVEVPAHQKLVPQSQRDLVIAVSDFSKRAQLLDLDSLSKVAPIIQEAGISKMVSTLNEIITSLEQIATK